MIKLADLIKEVKLETGNRINLGDGFVLRHIVDNIFKAYDGNGDLALSIYVVTHSSKGLPLRIPYVSGASVVPEYRGKGLYRRALPILKDTYGAIRSDDYGEITGDAEQAWQAVGARIIKTHDKSEYGGSWYVLEK